MSASDNQLSLACAAFMRGRPFKEHLSVISLLCFLLGLSACVRGGKSPAPNPPSLIDHLSLSQPTLHTGMCDASGAVPIGSNFFAVVNDEDDIVRLYRSDQPGPAVKQFDFSSFLEGNGKSPEADLEGAARIGDRVFWIGSHGGNKDAEERLNRRCLFATDIRMTNGEVALAPVGRPCKRLLDDLLGDSRFDRFHLRDAARRAPKEPDALDIEGLSATAEGHLLIGFRNPIPAGKALLIPLLNPNEVIAGQPARFDPAIQLSLGGRGIRDIAWHDGAYLIIAGSYREGGDFRLYRWTGLGAAPELLKATFPEDSQPEAIVIYPQQGLKQVQILSDDGTFLIDGCPCKSLKDPSRKMFRSFWVRQ